LENKLDKYDFSLEKILYSHQRADQQTSRDAQIVSIMILVEKRITI